MLDVICTPRRCPYYARGNAQLLYEYGYETYSEAVRALRNLRVKAQEACDRFIKVANTKARGNSSEQTDEEQDEDDFYHCSAGESEEEEELEEEDN
ncbi:hypothetical protein FHL15_003779 [Xylaria flabelliformis]|uniref:Uncharacterized protein n=1 Tax=Xylaria flabelliformis TaxID=2512241 RepID=A0A553I5G6_9PEZI|nr:hypothetical protein FHL15_003779 [Xylaria flabelliformis]